MAKSSIRKPAARVADAAGSVGFLSLIVAAFIVPVALVLKAYGVTLLVVLLLVLWQLLAAVVSWFISGEARRRRRFRYRLTGWGVAYCAISATFVFVSLKWGVNLIYLTTGFLVGGVGCAVLFPRLSLGRTRARWSAPAHVFAGEPFPVEVGLRNERRLLSAFGVSVGAGADGLNLGERRHILRLAPGREQSAALTHYLPERGMQRLRPVAVSTSFPFGVVVATMLCRPKEELLVLPRLGHIDRELLRRRHGGEARWISRLQRPDPHGDFRSLREYKHGDNPRNIHWPTSARMKKLFVREFERREVESVLLLLDAYVPPHERAAPAAWQARFETAVSFTATMASLLAERSIFHAFASFCPELTALPYEQGPGHLFSVLEALAMAEPTERREPAELVQALSFQEVAAGGACLVTPGPLPPERRASVLGPLAQNSLCIDVSEPGFHDVFSN